jgi:AsmA family protein
MRIFSGRRLLRIGGWLFALLLIVIGAAGGALWLGGARAVTWLIEHPVSAAVGRQIRIAGPLVIDWGAPTRIVVGDIHVANASWGSQPEMFSAQRLEIEIFARTLLFGPTRIPSIAFDGAKLLLETSDHGDANWNFAPAAAAPKQRSEFPHIQHIIVTRGEIAYRNGETAAQSTLAITDLRVDQAADDAAGTNGSPPDSPLKVALDGAFQSRPLKLDGQFGSIAELRTPTKPYPVGLSGKLGETKFATDGTIKEPLDFAGLDLRLSLEGKKLHELADILGVPFPTMPDFRGTSKLSGGNGDWHLDALTLKTGASDLEGGLEIDTNAKVPRVVAKLTAHVVDLADFKGVFGGTPERATAEKKKPADSDRLIPDTPIAVQKLPGLNADLTFDGARVKSVGGIPFERLSLGLQLKDGVLTVKPLRFHTADGDVDLNLRFTPFTSKTPPRLGGEIDVRHVDLHKLLQNQSSDMAKHTGGRVGGFVKLDTNGVSMRELLGRMNGDAGLFMENGQVSDLLQRLAPIDVIEALGVYAIGDKPVPINCLVSRFALHDGVASASTFLVDTSDTQVTGEGDVNFATEGLSLSLKPKNKHFTVASLRTPVDVHGTLAKPEFDVKAGALIARLGAAAGLGVLFPPAALVPLIDTGLGEHNACAAAYAAQQPPGNPAPRANPDQR